MGCDVSFSDRTAILLGIQNRDTDANGCGLLPRSANLVQIPIYNAFNPLTPQGNTQALNRAKPSLDPEGVTIQDVSNAIAGEIYVYGSGISNLPPDWMQLLRACGFMETRTASIAEVTAGSFAATPGASGDMDDGTYEYSFTVLFKSDGTTEATTIAEAAFESVVNVTDAVQATTVAGAGSGSVALSNLPTDGIKRIYRTSLRNGLAAVYPGSDITRTLRTGRKQYVGQVEDGITDFTDTIHDQDLGVYAPIPSAPQTATPMALTTAGGALTLLGDYNWKFTSLYNIDGDPVTSSELAVTESVASAAINEVLETTDQSATISSLPADGVKRLYRTAAGGPDYYFVAEVADGDTSYIDTLADASLTDNDPLVAAVDEALYTPVSEYLEFDAMWYLTYLDSRKYPTGGARGTIDFNGTAGQNFTGAFNQTGIYYDSDKEANPAAEEGPGAPPQICGAEFQITAQSTPTVTRTPKFKTIGVNLGRAIAPRRDGNQPCENAGLEEYLISERPDPRLVFTAEVPKEINAATDTDWVGDFKSGEKFHFTFHIGSDARKRVFFENTLPWGSKFYGAQLIEAPTFDRGEGGLRIFNANMLLTGTTNRFLRIRHTV